MIWYPKLPKALEDYPSKYKSKGLDKLHAFQEHSNSTANCMQQEETSTKRIKQPTNNIIHGHHLQYWSMEWTN